MKIHFIHAMDKDNPGDWWATPKHYFPQFKHATVGHINEFNESVGEVDVLVYGGGDLLSSGNNKYRKWLKKNINLHQPKKLVAWGLGLNPGFVRMNGVSLLKEFDFLGIRNPSLARDEFNKDHVASLGQYEYVPCASCLHEVFDNNDAEIKFDTGIIHHKNWPINNRWIRRAIEGQNYAQIFNSPNDIETVVNFIKSCDKIITSSYHGAYWAMLLGKKTLVVKQRLHAMIGEIDDPRYKMLHIHRDQHDVYGKLWQKNFSGHKIPTSWKFSWRTLGGDMGKVKNWLHSINNWRYGIQDKNFLAECRITNKNFFNKVFESDIHWNV